MLKLSFLGKKGSPIKLVSPHGRLYKIATPCPNPEIDSFFVFGVLKSGSTFLNKMIKDSCVLSNVPVVDLPQSLFKYGEELSSMHAKSAKSIFQDKGYCYLGFREVPEELLRNFDIKNKKKIFLIRDPRDALVSFFFSVKHSHTLPQKGELREKILKKRTNPNDNLIDSFVSNHTEQFLKYYELYENNIKDENLLLFRYEDVVFNKSQFLENTLSHFGLSLSGESINQIAKKYDIFPSEEKIDNHIRQVTPGNYKKHLSTETIDYLNQTFKKWLVEFGYE